MCRIYKQGQIPCQELSIVRGIVVNIAIYLSFISFLLRSELRLDCRQLVLAFVH